MRFLHTADCHIGCRQYGMFERELDFYCALNKIFTIAVEEKVDAVVIAGDLFDSTKPSSKAVYEVRKLVSDFELAGIEVLGVEGNHDLTGNGYWLRVCGIWPLGILPKTVNGCNFNGFDYARSDELLNRMETRSEEDRKADDDVVVMHAGFSEMGDSFNADLSVGSVTGFLKKMGTKYVANGHIHIPMEQMHDGILFVQPGSIEMKSLDEPQDKSVEIVEFDTDARKIASVRKIPYQTRHVHFINIEKDEDVAKMVEAGCDGLKDTLVVAYVSSAVDNGISRVEDWLKRSGLLFRVVPVSSSSEIVGGSEFDRSKAMISLKDAVDAYFDEDDERHKLVMEILSTDNVRHVVEKFLNGETK